jgi:co-chaperonin GroES (HSP10)
MKPIGKNILINIIEEEIETSSGILLSAEESNQLRYKKGFIVEPGSDVTVISKGDTIYYDKRAGYTMMIGSESYTIISERDVVVVL